MTPVSFARLQSLYRGYRQSTVDTFAMFEACVGYAQTLIGLDNPDKDDIAHAAACKALDHLEQPAIAQHFNAWFTRLVRNMMRDNWRKQNSRERHESQGMVYPSSAFSPHDATDAIAKAGDHKLLISLLFAGYTLDEAATHLQVSKRTILKRLKSLKAEVNDNV